ncbi:MAG: hypothetical protein G01um101472_406 [Parcubacteria group bacterium Gr01-1014_72]|nr:MAG: hypothetical protein G01um101472_406 [Parcubacteria group bacterium Gr01-1014_72]
MVLVLDVSLDNEGGNLIAHRSDEVPIAPEFSSPQLLLHLWKFLEDLSCGYAFQNIDNLGGSNAWGGGGVEMEVVGLDILLDDFKSIRPCYFGKEVFKKFLHLFGQHPFSVLGWPDKVVIQLVDRVCCPSDCHTVLS